MSTTTPYRPVPGARIPRPRPSRDRRIRTTFRDLPKTAVNRRLRPGTTGRLRPRPTGPRESAYVVRDSDDSGGRTPRPRGPGATADTVGDYLRSARRIPLVSAEDEVSLALRIEAGRIAERKAGERVDPVDVAELEWIAGDGRRARNQLIEANLRLVVSVAWHYTGRGLPLADLIQEGNLGLIRAVEKFDYTRGHKFSTYASGWIRQAIACRIADLDRETPTCSLVEVGDRESPPSLAPDPLEEVEDAVAVDQVLAPLLKLLTPRERRVLELRHGIGCEAPCTLARIGVEYDVTRERVRQIEAKALKKIRTFLALEGRRPGIVGLASS